jgi:hypothetical protein
LMYLSVEGSTLNTAHDQPAQFVPVVDGEE